MTGAPAQPESDYGRAVAAFQAERYKLAVLHGEKARAKHPNDPRLLQLLGQSLARSGRPAQALTRLRQALKLAPGDPTIRHILASTLDESGKWEEALAEVESLLEQDPLFVRAVTLRGTIFRRLGRGAEAWAWLEPRLSELPPTPILALSAASLIPSDADPAPVLALLRHGIADPATPLVERRALLYALGNALDRAGSYPEAFAACESAARLIPDRQTDQHAQLLERMSPETLAKIEPADVDASPVVLVCGMPRSGTTLTERVLAAHPKAATVGESPMINELSREVLRHAEEHGFVPAELTTRLARDYLKHLRSDATPDPKKAERIIDKMPQNLMHLGVVDRLLPGCRVIRCVRDPRDIARSCFFMDFGSKHTYRRTLDALADEILTHQRAADRWRAETSLRIFESHLEDLTADPERHTRSLLEFIGLEWDDRCLRFHESAGHVMTASDTQVRSGFNRQGHARWRHYERQLAPILDRLEPLVREAPAGGGTAE